MTIVLYNKFMESKFKQYGKLVHYKKGNYLIKQNYPIVSLVCIINGRAKAIRFREDGFEILLEIFKFGDILGDIELMLQKDTYSTSVKAIDDIDVYCMPINIAKKLIKTDIIFSNNIANQLANKLYNTSNQISINNTMNVKQRFIQYLEFNCNNDIFNENIVEVAQLLSVSYRHLLRVINILSKENILQIIPQSNKKKRVYKINRNNI